MKNIFENEIDVEKADIRELSKMDVTLMSDEQLRIYEKIVDGVKAIFDAHKNLLTYAQMKDDGIDIIQFKIDYAYLTSMKNNINREKALREEDLEENLF